MFIYIHADVLPILRVRRRRRPDISKSTRKKSIKIRQRTGCVFFSTDEKNNLIIREKKVVFRGSRRLLYVLTSATQPRELAHGLCGRVVNYYDPRLLYTHNRTHRIITVSLRPIKKKKKRIPRPAAAAAHYLSVFIDFMCIYSNTILWQPRRR